VKFDPGTHKGMHSFLSLKLGVVVCEWTKQSLVPTALHALRLGLASTPAVALGGHRDCWPMSRQGRGASHAMSSLWLEWSDT
jgi:hypothetical protein